jgi:CubicO group peptidase (beta-lactamase class C family)
MRRGAVAWTLALAACSAPVPPATSPLDRSVPAVLAQDGIPGAVVLIGGAEGVRYFRAFGEARLDTVWDLASCTKVVATTTAAMKLVEEGRLGLHDPVSKYVPCFAGRDVTLEELLTHRSGLPAYLTPRPEWSGDDILRRIAELKAAKEYRYSCLNMITLARVVEEVAGRSLADYCRTEIFEPLGMKDTGFAPSASRCAATAGDVAPGVVHDPLARAYGTPAHRPGNAGLFSTAGDLGIFCRALLAGKILKPETVRRMFTPNADSRGLGWDVFDDAPYRPGVGHTGFTGTLIWLDPAGGRYALVLSNRTLRGEKTDVRRLRREVLATLNP